MLIQSDYHIHATWHCLQSTPEEPGAKAHEQVAAARRYGSKYVGVLEHCNLSPWHPFSCLEGLSAEYYAADFDRENVFLGVEADLTAEGSDICGENGRKKLKLHYVIGSVHLSPEVMPDVREYIETEHKWLVRTLQNNTNVDIIGHPFGEGFRWAKAGLIERWDWSMIPEKYLEEIIRLAQENNKALEANRCDFEDPVYVDFLKKIRDGGLPFTVGSDAHWVEAAELVVDRTEQLGRMGFSEENHWKPAAIR